jgi:hypothetical protein
MNKRYTYLQYYNPDIILYSKIYAKQKARQKRLIKKLFWSIAEKTLLEHNIDKNNLELKFRLDESYYAYVRGYKNIRIGLACVKDITKNGITDCYYKGRKNLINKYVLKNRHNTIRLIIYHELKHLCDYYTGYKNELLPDLYSGGKNERLTEYRADSYALKYLKHSRNAIWNK